MSSDVRWFIKCKECGEKVYLGHYKTNETAVRTNYNRDSVLATIYEFMTEHIWFNNGRCCNFDFYDHEAIFEKDEQKTGFEIVRENG